ncbi:MAG: hydrolase [Proteobacteria bacterium]|nr:hydrolase [Pseudomonadota bacterium]
MSKQHSDGFVDVGGLRLHFEKWGTGPRVLIGLHGTSLHGKVWERLAQALSDEFTIYGLDQRGHGDSEAAPAGQYTVDFYATDLALFIDALGLERVAFAGSSLGSRVALAYSARHVDRVERLALLDLSFEMPKHASDAMIAAHISRPRTFANFDEALVFSRTLPQRKRFSDELHISTLKGDLRQNPDGRLEWRYNRDVAIETLSVAARDMWPEVRAVEAPVLLLRGAESDVLVESTLSRLLKEFQHAQLVTIPNAGHSIWGDNPIATTAALKHFIEGEELALTN